MFELKTIEISKTGALTHTSKLSFLIIIKKDGGKHLVTWPEMDYRCVPK